MIVYYFQKNSGKSSRKINGTQLVLGRSAENFRKNFPETTEHLYRKSSFFERNVPIGNSCSISWKPSVWYRFTFPLFFGKWNWFVKWVNVIRDKIYQSVNPLTSAIRQSKNDSSQVMTRPVCSCKCLKTNAILVRSHLTHFQIGNSACSISWNPSLINVIPRRNLPVREMTDQCPCKW